MNRIITKSWPKLSTLVNILLIFIIILYSLSGKVLSTSSHQKKPHEHHYKLQKSAHHFDKAILALGNSHIIPKGTVYGAIILSDRLTASNLQKEDPKKYNMTLKLISSRVRNYHLLQSQLPFLLSKWSPVMTAPCPQWPSGHTTERGLLWAHYRIWKDFVYFDWLLEKRYEAYRRRNNQTTTATAATGTKSMISMRNSSAVVSSSSSNLTTSSSNQQLLSSEDGLYAIDLLTGARYKQGQLLREEDILVLFEDDAMAVINDVNTTVIEELSLIGVDLLYLGWCEGRTARPVPLCAHAYALTRRGARKAIQYLEPCGRALDEQLVMIIKNNWLTYRRAWPSSFKVLKSGVRIYGDKTAGIFRQCKDACGSVNGHRRRQRV